MELTGLRYRSALGVTVQIAFSIGYMMQPAMAIFLRDEFYYQLAHWLPISCFRSSLCTYVLRCRCLL